MQIENKRNFVIISHIDHGKSTLADRLLEITNTIAKREMHAQMLDSMDLERERGITIKMTPVRMHYLFGGVEYELNLIDTPGHVDFSYEVSRALAAVEGAILLVDATKGVQAQTLAHLREAQKQGLTIIPAVNKIDLPIARPDEIEQEIRAILPNVEKIFRISGKTGDGVAELIDEVIHRVPPPEDIKSDRTRALIFDSVYDAHKGVLAYVRVVEGSFSSGEKISFAAQKRESSAIEIGYFSPTHKKIERLEAGSIGYIATGIKEPEIVRVGDTVATGGGTIEAIAGYREPTPVVFASIFPAEGVDIKLLKDAFSRLKLTDWALTFEPESSDILGRGFRCGFLGSLHLEIVLERLKREFTLDFIATTPSVGYEILLTDGTLINVYSPSSFPGADRIVEIREPWVGATVFVPSKYLGGVLELMHERRGIQVDTKYLSEDHVEVIYDLPLSEIIVDFYDKLKSVSSGFASFAYEQAGVKKGDLVKLSILVAGDEVEAFSRIVPKERAYQEGKQTVERLKELLPKQWFVVPIQAAVGGKILARETISALRKDVTGYLYGGDVTRKKKLLEKQKRGKKKMKERGKVNIPSDIFVKMLRRSSSDGQ